MEALFMENLTDGLKKLLLAGIGAAAATAEKSKDILDDLVKKGELTVEQGKTLNEELKHKMEENKEKTASGTEKQDSGIDLSKLTPEQLSALKEQLGKMDKPEE